MKKNTSENWEIDCLAMAQNAELNGSVEASKQMVDFIRKTRQEAKQELIDGLIEWAEKNAWIGDVYKTTGRILYLSDLIHHLNSLK